MIKQPTPNKTASVPLDFSGLYIGIVRKSDSNGVFVEIPQITTGFSFGPCNVLSTDLNVQKTSDSISTETQTKTFLTNVTVSRVRPAVGSKVICGFLNNTFDEVIIFGSIL